MACILIVDDRPLNRRYLTSLLEGVGHRTLEAGDGAEALTLVRANRPDLVITDLMMPIMDGFEFTRRLRADAELAATKVVFHTATYRGTQARALARACGVSVVLPKPSPPRHVLDAVNELLGTAAPSASRNASPAAADGASPLAGLSQRFAGHIGQASRIFALIELALDLAVERDRATFLRMFCEAGLRIVDARAVVLVLLGPDGCSVRHVEAQGLTREGLRSLREPDALRGLIARVVRCAGALREGDGVSALTGLPGAFAEARSLLGVPLGTDTERDGIVLFIDTLAGRDFDAEDEMLAMAMAAEFAVMSELLDTNEALLQRAVELQLEIVQRQQAEEATKEYRLELGRFAQRLLDQEKVTTRRLAQALHDELGQTLAAIRLTFDAGARAGAAAPARADLMRRLDELIAEANRQVRQVLTELRPPLLDAHGLVTALDNELRQRTPEAGSVALRLDVAKALRGLRWPADVEYAAFMIAREGIANALRHARAAVLRVALVGGAEYLVLTVADDGRGLPGGGAEAPPGHLGMVGMRERALAIGARLDVQSSPGCGTVVNLRWGTSGEPALPDR